MKTVRLSGHVSRLDRALIEARLRDAAGFADSAKGGEAAASSDAAETERRASRRHAVQSVTVRGAAAPSVHQSGNPLVTRAPSSEVAVDKARSNLPDTDRGLLAALAAIETAAARPPARAADRYDHDEPTHEVLRLPAAWYAGPLPAPTKAWSAEVKAGVFGLGAGLCLVVPFVLFLGGWFGGTTSSALAPSAATTQKITPVAASLVSPEARPLVQVQAVRTQPISDQVAPAALTSVKIVADPDVILAEVRRSMTAGDIETARLLLAHPVSTGQGEAILLLGETFDPNVLAALGTRGVAADVGRARALYEEAGKRGAATAAMRLKGLN